MPTINELKQKCKRAGITGYSHLRKSGLEKLCSRKRSKSTSRKPRIKASTSRKTSGKKLLSIKKLPTSDSKKWVATFENNGRKKSVKFGAQGYKDYTQHHDKDRRVAYRNRHKSDRINVPDTPGALSWFVLWGDSTNAKTNISKYKKHFGL